MLHVCFHWLRQLITSLSFTFQEKYKYYLFVLHNCNGSTFLNVPLSEARDEYWNADAQTWRLTVSGWEDINQADISMNYERSLISRFKSNTRLTPTGLHRRLLRLLRSLTSNTPSNKSPIATRFHFDIDGLKWNEKKSTLKLLRVITLWFILQLSFSFFPPSHLLESSSFHHLLVKLAILKVAGTLLITIWPHNDCHFYTEQ